MNFENNMDYKSVDNYSKSVDNYLRFYLTCIYKSVYLYIIKGTQNENYLQHYRKS